MIDTSAHTAADLPKVVTRFINPPIPDRSHDWMAWFSFHDGDTDLMGYGETEESAIIDLIGNAMDYDGDGSEQEVVQDFAIAFVTARSADEVWNEAIEAALKEINSISVARKDKVIIHLVHKFVSALRKGEPGE